jgi:hypothetical protein
MTFTPLVLSETGRTEPRQKPTTSWRCMEIHLEKFSSMHQELNELLSKAPIVLNQSSLKEYNNCRRLFGWTRLENLAPPDRRSALEIGTAIHKGLGVLHAGQSIDDAVNVAKASLEEAAGPLRAFADKDLAEANAIVERVLPAYYEHWANAGELWTPLGQEIQALVEVGEGTNVWLRMKADNLSTVHDALYIVDYKTAGRMDPRDLLKYEMDMQISAYLDGLTKQLSQDSMARGGPAVIVRGAIIDVLVKTKVPQFARETYTRSYEELMEFEAEFVEYAKEIRRAYARVASGENWKIVFPRNTEHCFRYGTCAFRDLCLKDTLVRRAMYDKRETTYVDEAQEQLNVRFETRLVH